MLDPTRGKSEGVDGGDWDEKGQVGTVLRVTKRVVLTQEGKADKFIVKSSDSTETDSLIQ